MISLDKLNLTEGHLIVGLELSPHLFVGRVKSSQLLQIAPNPMDSEDSRKVAGSKVLQEIADVRQEVQRLFVGGSKKRNVEPYSQYILALREGEDGITPPIMLYSEKQLTTQVDPVYQLGGILVPYDRPLIAIDGETQLAARWLASEAYPETKGDTIAVVIVHGHDKAWARQAFHDLNVLGIRPNAAVSIGMDNRDPLTQVAREIERRVPFFRDRVNTVRRQLKSSDTDVVTITALRGACTTFAEGIAGVKYGARPVAISADKLPQLRDRAVDWFGALTELLGPAMENREHRIASAPSMLAALGAVGNGILNVDRSAVEEEVAARLAKLRTVNWDRGSHWEGIAGKVNPKGVLSIGGSKENAYAIYAALMDETSPGFARIRTSPFSLVANS